MKDARFEELLDEYQVAVRDRSMCIGCDACINQNAAARLALIAYFEERTAENCNRDAELIRCRLAIPVVREALKNIPCGGIGEGGPTLEELNAVAEAGYAFDDDAMYHQAQLAWRLLEGIR